MLFCHVIFRHAAHISICLFQPFGIKLHLCDNMPLLLPFPANPDQPLFLQLFHKEMNPFVFRRALIEVSRQRLFREAKFDMDVSFVPARGKQAGLIGVQKFIQNISVILHHYNISPQSLLFHPS